MKAPASPKRKTMGKKVAIEDQAFSLALKEMFGNKNAKRIIAKPSAMKRAYGMYLQSRLSDFTLEYDEIPF